jgi:hypothetical protein
LLQPSDQAQHRGKADGGQGRCRAQAREEHAAGSHGGYKQGRWLRLHNYPRVGGRAARRGGHRERARHHLRRIQGAPGRPRQMPRSTGRNCLHSTHQWRRTHKTGSSESGLMRASSDCHGRHQHLPSLHPSAPHRRARAPGAEEKALCIVRLSLESGPVYGQGPGDPNPSFTT